MEDPRGVIERQRDALNAHDLDALADTFHEDLQSDDFVHPSHSFVGREQVRRNWELVLSQVPDLKADLVGTAVDGDTVWAEWKISGTHRSGDFLNLHGVTISRVRDGRVASSRRYLTKLVEEDETVDDHFRRLVEPTRD